MSYIHWQGIFDLFRKLQICECYTLNFLLFLDTPAKVRMCPILTLKQALKTILFKGSFINSFFLMRLLVNISAGNRFISGLGTTKALTLLSHSKNGDCYFCGNKLEPLEPSYLKCRRSNSMSQVGGLKQFILNSNSLTGQSRNKGKVNFKAPF